MKLGEQIAQEALTWLGTPYISGARVKGVGTDCANLLVGISEQLKITQIGQVRIPQHSNEWHLHKNRELFLQNIKLYCDEVEDLQIGDFLLYKYGRVASHGAVYVGDNHVVHAKIQDGVILTDMKDVMFYTKSGKSRLVGIYRVNTDKIKKAVKKWDF